MDILPVWKEVHSCQKRYPITMICGLICFYYLQHNESVNIQLVKIYIFEAYLGLINSRHLKFNQLMSIVFYNEIAFAKQHFGVHLLMTVFLLSYFKFRTALHFSFLIALNQILSWFLQVHLQTIYKHIPILKSSIALVLSILSIEPKFYFCPWNQK